MSTHSQAKSIVALNGPSVSRELIFVPLGMFRNVGDALRGLVVPPCTSPGANAPAIARLPGAPRESVLLLDRSPSMDLTDWKPSRIAAAKKSAQAFVERLASEEPEARVTVIAYDCHADLLVPSTSASDVKTIVDAVQALRSGTGTNITDALRLALSILGSSSGPAQVVLLTDGHHNLGPRPSHIVKRLRARATVDCVGIGGKPADVDEALLRRIASPRADGTPRYRWIGHPDQLVQHFRQLAARITRA